VTLIRKPVVRCIDEMWSFSSVLFSGRVVTRANRMKHPRLGAGDVHKMRIFYPKHYPVPKVNVVLLLLFIVIYAFTFVPK